MRKPFSPFRIHKSDDDQFYFTILGKNGEVVTTPETHPKKQTCKSSINALARNIAFAWNNNVQLAVDTTVESKTKK